MIETLSQKPYNLHVTRLLVESHDIGNVKQMGLKTLSAVVNNLDALDSQYLRKPLEIINSYLEKLKPCQLFTDWAPQHVVTSNELNLEQCKASASSSTDNTSPNHAFSNVVGKWSAKVGEENLSTWSVSFEKPHIITMIKIIFSCHPYHVVVLAKPENPSSPLVTLACVSTYAISNEKSILLPPYTTDQLTLVFMDNRSEAKPCSIDSIQFYTSGNAELYSSDIQTLKDIESCLKCCCTPSNPLKKLTFTALFSFSLCTGSLASLLSMIKILLNDQYEFEDESEINNFMKLLLELCNALDDNFILMNNDAESDAVFLQSLSGDDIKISLDGKTVTSLNDSKTYAIVDYPCDEGKYTWTFKSLDSRESDEMTCFGAAIYPVTEKEYLNSKEMWMWRAYNGSLYSQGNQLANKVEKIHNNDLVRFELDCDEHVMRLFLNDKEMSESFKNVKGTIYPAVAFYGPSRSVELISVEKMDKKVTEAVVYLCMQQLKSSNVGYGTIGLNDNMGYDDLKIKINKELIRRGVSIHPPSNGTSQAVFSIPSGHFCRFTTKVGINDDVNCEVSGCVFRVKSDNTLLWESSAINRSGVIEKCDIQLDSSFNNIILEVECKGLNNCCHAVFINPILLSNKLPNNMKIYLDIQQSKPKNSLELAHCILRLIENQCKYHIANMSSIYKINPLDTEGINMEEPYSIDCTSESLTLIYEILKDLLSDWKNKIELIIEILYILYATLRKIVHSNIDMNVIGLYQHPILSKFIELLDEIISNDEYPLSIGALSQEILNSSQSILFPDSLIREEKFKKTIEEGCIIEIQFSWPVLFAKKEKPDDLCENDNTDYRYDTVVCNIQAFCIENNIRHKLYGKMNGFIYLIFELEPKCGNDILDKIVDIMTENDLDPFTFLDGSEENQIFVQTEHFPSFNRHDRENSEPGNGIIRIYPKGRCSFDDLGKYIQNYLNSF